jgi:hypothetical protein
MWTLRVNDDRLDRPKDDVMHGQLAAVITSSFGQRVDLNAALYLDSTSHSWKQDSSMWSMCQ